MANASASISVEPSSYAESNDVRVELAESERQDAYNAGMADVRLYETQACVNCKIMADRIAALLDNNPRCIAYERLPYWTHLDELEADFEPTDELPNIIIDGENGRATAAGLVSTAELKKKIRSVSECDPA